MTIANKDGRLVLLISSLLIVVPMVIFPSKLGMDLAAGSFIYSVVEILYYGVMLFIFRPKTSPAKLLAGSGLTFLYRVALGTLFGVLIAIMYNVGFSAALTLGISRYLPAILIQVLVAPWAMRPIYLSFVGEEPRSARRPTRSYPKPTTEREESSRPHLPPRAEPRPLAGHDRFATDSRPELTLGPDINGFERAVKYLGEHHAVLVATVVDGEGLTMASYKKGELDPGDWAPLSLLFQQSLESILKRNKEGNRPDRIDLAFGTRKLAIMKTSDFNLLVLSNREEDDLLGIRITQAAEIVRKYVSERYGRVKPSAAEEKYVRNS